MKMSFFYHPENILVNNFFLQGIEASPKYLILNLDNTIRAIPHYSSPLFFVWIWEHVYNFIISYLFIVFNFLSDFFFGLLSTQTLNFGKNDGTCGCIECRSYYNYILMLSPNTISTHVLDPKYAEYQNYSSYSVQVFKISPGEFCTSL